MKDSNDSRSAGTDELYVEILNRLNRAIELHPYLSGLMTGEFQSFLTTLSRKCGIKDWTPGEPHEDWEIDGDTLIKFDEE